VSGTFVLTVVSVNDAPGFVKGADQTVLEDAGAQTVPTWATAINAGPVNEPAETISFTVSSDHPELFSAQPAISPTGTLTYTLAADANGTAIVSVVAQDTGGTANGGLDTSVAQTFTITVTPVNDAPTLNALTELTFPEDSALQTVNLSGIAAGVRETQSLTVKVSASEPTLFAILEVVYTSPNATGVLNLAPRPNASGESTISVVVTDDGGIAGGGVNSVTKSFQLTVTPVNDSPTITPITDQTLLEDAATGTILFSVGDLETPPENLLVAGTSSNPDLIPVTGIVLGGQGANRTVAVTPAKDQNGTASITLRVADGEALQSSVQFNVLVSPVNDAPTLAAIAPASVSGDAGPQVVNLTGIAAGPGNEVQALTITASSSNPGLIPDPVIAYASPEATARLNYESVANGNGTATITVVVRDDGGTENGGGDSVSNSFVVSVGPLNDPPGLAAIANQSVDEGSLLTVNSSASDPDAGSVLRFSLDPGAPSGASIDPDTGVFTWTPTESQGPGSVTITVRVTDNATPPASATQSFGVLVNEVNTSPVIGAVGATTVTEGNTLSFSVGATDSDIPANALNFSLGAGAPSGASISSGGTFSWTPSEQQGPGSYSITVQVSDNGTPGLSASQTFSVSVDELNSPPVLAPVGSQSVNEGSPLSVTLTASDSDLPAQALTFSLGAGAPEGASLSTGGLFTWTPTEAQGPGVYSITFAVTDNGPDNLSVTGTFSVAVNEVNQAPALAGVGNQTVREGNPMTLVVAGVDSDLPAQKLTFSLGSGAPSGMSIDASSGSISWTPGEAQGPGTYAIGVTVTDDGPGALTATQTFSVAVLEVNATPVLADIADQSVKAGAALTVTVAATDPDLPVNNLVYSLTGNVPAGASINPATGVFTWTPTLLSSAGTTVITAQVTDNGSPALSATKSFSAVVSPSNTAPRMSPIADQTVDEGKVLSLNVRFFRDFRGIFHWVKTGSRP
jgi:hypothetical protein